MGHAQGPRISLARRLSSVRVRGAPPFPNLSKVEKPVVTRSIQIRVLVGEPSRMKQRTRMYLSHLSNFVRHTCRRLPPLTKPAVDENALLQLLDRWRMETGKAGHQIKRIAVGFQAGRERRGAQGVRHRGPCHPEGSSPKDHCNTRAWRPPSRLSAGSMMSRIYFLRPTGGTHGAA